MTTEIQKPTSLGREADYLGVLGTELRNLLGYSTLAYELVQNAEDSDAATRMTFDVGPEALIVDNDGTFSDCGAVEEDDCPWLRAPGEHAHRCDFHSFRIVGSGDKRLRERAIGAFGIGFTAVYQITDRPELISRGRHWKLHEEAHAQERIKLCSGCPNCRSTGLPGTRFILPWAFDPNTPLRQRLRVDSLTATAPDEIAEELRRTLPTALLFLSKLDKLEIRQQGKTVRSWCRISNRDSLRISDGSNEHVWYLLHDSFSATAKQLRQQHGDRIEGKRSDIVTLAIPSEPIDSGVFCAFLPTQQRTELPFHINADFFPKSDRKEIILDSGYQAAWNRAAIAAAADALAQNLVSLRDKIDHRQLWRIIEAVDRVGRDAESGHRDEAFGFFKGHVSQVLAGTPIVYTSTNEWMCGEHACFLEKEEEEACISVLEGLGLRIVHNHLRFAQNLLLSKAVGVRHLDGVGLARALRNAGLDRRVKEAELPSCLRDPKAFPLLWSEIDTLIEQVHRRDRPHESEVVDQLAACAIAPAADGDIWPCNQVFRANPQTVGLFQPLLAEIPFLSDQVLAVDVFRSLCPEFAAQSAIDALHRLPQDSLRTSLQLKPGILPEILTWFEDRRIAILENHRLVEQLAKLPLFPSSSGPRILSDLVLPGDFDDPLGLADVVDLEILGGRRDFLRSLGAKELTFEVYARDQVPRALANVNLTPSQRRNVARLLADGLGRIRDDRNTLDELASVAVVECTDGVFRLPKNVYFANDTIKNVLGATGHIALIPSEHSSAIIAFYLWLGVAVEPRLADVFARIDAAKARVPERSSVETVRTAFAYLADRARNKEIPSELSVLKCKSWLPARNDRSKWHKPSELFADFSAYLFESQAQFLDVPQRMQQGATELLTFLGVHTTPTEAQVVSHLLHCAGESIPVNREVYRWLNDRFRHPAIARLDGERCLMLEESGVYLRPTDVFWQQHNFGRWRRQLVPGARKYNDLLSQLGVKEIPDWSDAVAVLTEIAEEYGSQSRRLDAEAQRVALSCWQMLDQALDGAEIEADYLQQLGEQRVICGADEVLCQPRFVYFDDRPGLAEKFGEFLRRNVIKRPLGAWRAMARAGVRSLSEAVESQLVEKMDPVGDAEIISRTTARRQLLARVLDFHRPGLADRLGRLEHLRCVGTRELMVIYTVNAFGREVASAPEAIQAHYLPADHTLYFIRRDGCLPWTAIARELATVLCPDDEPGHLTADIRSVLAADSIAEAKSELDESAIPDLAEAASNNVSVPLQVSDFGFESLPSDPSLNSEPSQDDGPYYQGSAPVTTNQAIDLLLGTGAPHPSPLPGELDQPDRPTTTAGSCEQRFSGETASHDRTDTGSRNSNPPGDENSSGTQQRPGPRRGYAVLRSYVMPDRNEDSSPLDDDGHVHRSETDQAGVTRVMQFERQQGRIPKEMPPRHPGYDIESEHLGEIERFIEVKSLSGNWQGPDAGLTKTQFEKATELGDRYWLYIVEQALQDDCLIHRVCDPAGKANQFLFDPGWKQVAEDTNPDDQATKEGE